VNGRIHRDGGFRSKAQEFRCAGLRYYKDQLEYKYDTVGFRLFEWCIKRG